MSSLRIIMYHYVRPRMRGRYPGLKVRDTEEFNRQLDYIGSNFNPVSAEDVRDALCGRKTLPDNACFLTFDDGYLDHYLTVFPALQARGWSGAFYPPVDAAVGRNLLEVNKIQLLLAHYERRDLDKLITKLGGAYEQCQKEDAQGELSPSFEHWRRELTEPGVYDSPDAVFVKRLLQYALPPFWRSRIVNRLFYEILDVEEESLVDEMYMNVDMLKVMARAGMHIGSHGSSHSWLSYLDPDKQELEIAESLKMLSDIYGDDNFMWSMCYPFGAYNNATIELCKNKSCAFAVTTEPATSEILEKNRFILPRLDTNSIPI